MSATRNTPDTFIQRLFEPLPEGEQPVMSRSFRKECAEAAQPSWVKARAAWDIAFYYGKVARAANKDVLQILRAYGLTITFEGTFSAAFMEKIEFKALNDLMSLAAPTKADLEWKKKRAAEWQTPSQDRWQALIAADEARLAGRVKMNKDMQP